MRLGINVGDTTTLAVLMKGTAILAEAQANTTPDIVGGISVSLRSILEKSNLDPNHIDAVTIGTSQFGRAIVERRNLSPVAIVRLGLPATQAILPFNDWPADLLNITNGHAYLAHGGYEFDGRIIARLRRSEIQEIANQIRDKGINAVAVSSVFSMVNASMEEEAAEIIRQTIPDSTITLSHEIGRMGLLERENAVILNSSLCNLAKKNIQGFRQTLAENRVQAPLYLSQNDGTSMTASYAEIFPMLTFSSTFSNAICGAAFLSGVRDAVVIDMGGGTSKAGVLVRGFPLESVFPTRIGGVRVNLQMPDDYTFNLGTGSLVSLNPLTIGPECIGLDLTKRSLVFGGDNLTAIDIAVAAGLTDVGKRSTVVGLHQPHVKRAVQEIQRMVEKAVKKMKVTSAPVLVVLVGGGSILVRPQLAGASEVIQPEYFAVARAVGAATGRVGGKIDRVYSLAQTSREAALKEAHNSAYAKTVAAGADPNSIKVVDEQVTPLNYLRGNVLRIRIRIMGDMVKRS